MERQGSRRREEAPSLISGLWIDTRRSVATVTFHCRLQLAERDEPGKVWVAVAGPGRRLTATQLGKLIGTLRSRNDGEPPTQTKEPAGPIDEATHEDGGHDELNRTVSIRARDGAIRRADQRRIKEGKEPLSARGKQGQASDDETNTSVLSRDHLVSAQDETPGWVGNAAKSVPPPPRTRSRPPAMRALAPSHQTLGSAQPIGSAQSIGSAKPISGPRQIPAPQPPPNPTAPGDTASQIAPLQAALPPNMTGGSEGVAPPRADVDRAGAQAGDTASRIAPLPRPLPATMDRSTATADNGAVAAAPGGPASAGPAANGGAAAAAASSAPLPPSPPPPPSLGQPAPATMTGLGPYGASGAGLAGAMAAGAVPMRWPGPEPKRLEDTGSLPRLENKAAAGHVKPREIPDEVVELLWYDDDAAPRLRRRWKELCEKLDFEPPDDKHDLATQDARRARLHHTHFGVLTEARMHNAAELRIALREAISEKGRFTPPLTLLRGNLRFPFEAVEILRATAAVVTPVAGSDKKLKEALDQVGELLATPLLSGSNETVTNFVAHLRKLYRDSRRSLSIDYLDEAVERLLLESRKYQKRTLFGGTWIRALLSMEGGDKGIPCYLPEDLDKQLPMMVAFDARMIAEAHVKQDQYETHPHALRVVTLGRVIKVEG